jgi:gas vesicle protein
MKATSVLFAASGLSCWLMAGLAGAQALPATPPATPAPPSRDLPSPDQPKISERPVVIAPAPASDRPGLPENPHAHTPSKELPPSETLRDLVKDFQSARQAYLKQQRSLLDQLKQSSAEEREAIRQQLKENLQMWLEEQKLHIQELRDQARDIRNNVPAIGDVIDAAKGEGRGR